MQEICEKYLKTVLSLKGETTFRQPDVPRLVLPVCTLAVFRLASDDVEAKQRD